MKDTPGGDELRGATVAQISELIGPGKTEQLCHHFGGISYHIPTAPTPKHHFLLCLTKGELEKLCHHFGGTAITLPKGKYSFKRALISDLLAEGRFSVRKIADIAGCTERYVSMLSGQAKNEQQQDLPLFRGMGG